MSGCSGKCDSCSTDTDCGPLEEPKLKYSTKPVEVDIKEFLKPLPKQKQDGSDLFNKCEHYEYGTIPRYQCEYCIREWVEAHDDETVELEAVKFRKEWKKVAADRIEEALKDKKRKRKIK